MAISRGMNKNMTGKLGNTVTYTLKTQTVTRTIGIITKKPSKKQKAAHHRLRLIFALLKPVKEFIRIGFEPAAKGTKWSAHNIATSENLLHALKGEGLKAEINWPLVTFTKGNLPVNGAINVEVVEDELVFSWNPEVMLLDMKDSDRIMVMVYCPEKKSATFLFDGNKRYQGSERMQLIRYRKKVVLQTYTAFISADRNSVSNTVYTGEILW